MYLVWYLDTAGLHSKKFPFLQSVQTGSEAHQPPIE